MFERKNQNILSEHYTKLVDHTEDGLLDGSGDGDEDFITLKRADHTLDDAGAEAEPSSKRKEKMAHSKKGLIKNGPLGKKLVFDDDGQAHELYEMQDDTAFREGDALGEGKKFAESERRRLREADVQDKAEAKTKKQEKKRKRKDRERAVSLIQNTPRRLCC